MDRTGRRPAAIQVAAPALTRPAIQPLTTRADWTGRLAALLTFERLLYAAFLLTAAVTRFWDLGSRALHHDESLHAYYSWLYAVGRGYVHDPMMHGPFLFHANALVYKLFGASDYTARIVPALFGTVLVGLPYLLRRQLGRVSMLAASFLLLISPQMWYYGRFIRNDIYGAVWTILIYIGIVRWLYSRNPAWLHLSWIAFVLLYCTKEISYIVLAVFASFLLAGFALAHVRRGFLWLVAGAVGTGITLIVAPKLLGWGPLPSIPFEQPNMAKSIAYGRALLTGPQVQLTLGWAVVWLAVAAYLLRRARLGSQWQEIRDSGAPVNALSAALAWGSRWKLHVLLFAAELLVISVPLYTSLFTNVSSGLATGSVGGLFYWLAQHGVRRGNQPWLYYLVMEPVYEPIAVLFGTLGTGYGMYWLVKWWRSGRTPMTAFTISYLLLVYWGVTSLGIYSWAGEKMPWLALHITLPFILLASVFTTRVLGLEDGYRRSQRRAAEAATFMVLLLAVAAWSISKMNAWTAAVAVIDSLGGVRYLDGGQSPIVYGLLAACLLTGAAVLRLGTGRALRAAGLVTAAVLALYTIRSAVLLSYVNGDVAVEQAIYTQTTPRVPVIDRAIGDVSAQTVGARRAAVIYDSSVSWPWVWYLRDYTNARFMADGPRAVPSSDVQFVLIGVENLAAVRPFMENYEEFQYPMRWWFPEETYRTLVPGPGEAGSASGRAVLQAKYLARAVAAWSQPPVQAQMWRYVMYRVPRYKLDSTDMVVFVRRDLVGKYNASRFR